ncbi:MAG: diacylglycerol/lipid kinase family protein [Desulfopila sp.]
MNTLYSPQERPACIGVLVNPLGGRNRRRQQALIALERRCRGAGIRVWHWVQTAEEIELALAECARVQTDILVIHGGDGTVQASLTVLYGPDSPFPEVPPLLLLKGGTTNLIAGDVGIAGSQEQALVRLCHWAEGDGAPLSAVRRPLLRLLVPGHGPKYGMFFGAGCVIAATRFYHQHLHGRTMQGLPGICMTAAHSLWTLLGRRRSLVGSTPMALHLSGERGEQGQFIIFLASTLQRFVFGLKPFWGQEEGRLRLTAVKSGARKLFWLLPWLAWGRLTRHGIRTNGYLSCNTDEVQLHLADSVVLDGEMYAPSSAVQPVVLQYGGEATFLQI